MSGVGILRSQVWHRQTNEATEISRIKVRWIAIRFARQIALDKQPHKNASLAVCDDIRSRDSNMARVVLSEHFAQVVVENAILRCIRFRTCVFPVNRVGRKPGCFKAIFSFEHTYGSTFPRAWIRPSAMYQKYGWTLQSDLINR